MLIQFRRLLALLTPQERRHGVLLLGLILIMALLDMVGVASIMPFIAVLANPELVENNSYLYAAYQRLGLSSADEFLYFLGIAFLITFVGSSAFKALTTKALLQFTYMRDYSLGRRLVAGYLNQPYEWFLSTHSADIGKTVLSEVAEVIIRALIPMLQLIAHGAVVLGMLILLIIVEPLLAGLLIAVLGGGYTITYLILRKYLGRIGADRLSVNRQRFKVLQEAFGGIKVIKVLNLEDTVLKRFDAPARVFARRHAALQVAAQLPRFALEAIAFGGMLLLVLYLLAESRDLQEILPLLALYAFAGYRLVPALQQVYTQASSLRFSGPAVEKLHEDLRQLRHRPSGNDIQTPAALRLNRCLRLDEVTYTYPGAKSPALSNLSLEIDACSTVGFVGVTGAGKSTVVDLILGLLCPQRGRIAVDGVVIDRSNIRAWQRSIGYVPQTIYLVDDTVAANIAFGLRENEIDCEAVERAAKIANLHQFVTQEMPEQYSTKLGERGVRLSGGQRQRIGLARALYHDPSILILDEATSALDTLTEKLVMDAVRNLAHRKTIILIAHRLSTVRSCDKIFLLEHGRLIGSGTYEVLAENHPQFRAMTGATHVSTP